MICLPNITGKDTPARIQGTVLSSLFARAISIAPADQGFVNKRDGFGAAGLPGCSVEGEGCRSEGERSGEEKERR